MNYWLNFIFLNFISSLLSIYHGWWGLLRRCCQKKGWKFSLPKEEMIYIVFRKGQKYKYVWESSQLFFYTIPKAPVFTFKHQVVEFKIYVMPFLTWKVKSIFFIYRAFLGRISNLYIFLLFSWIVNIIEFVNQSDNNIKI